MVIRFRAQGLRFRCGVGTQGFQQSICLLPRGSGSTYRQARVKLNQRAATSSSTRPANRPCAALAAWALWPSKSSSSESCVHRQKRKPATNQVPRTSLLWGCLLIALLALPFRGQTGIKLRCIYGHGSRSDRQSLLPGAIFSPWPGMQQKWWPPQSKLQEEWLAWPLLDFFLFLSFWLRSVDKSSSPFKLLQCFNGHWLRQRGKAEAA